MLDMVEYRDVLVAKCFGHVSLGQKNRALVDMVNAVMSLCEDLSMHQALLEEDDCGITHLPST